MRDLTQEEKAGLKNHFINTIIKPQTDNDCKKLLRQVYYQRTAIGEKVEDIILDRNPELAHNVQEALYRL